MNPQPPQVPQKKKMSGCLVALIVCGVLGCLVCLCTAVSVALIASSDFGRQVAPATWEGMRAIQEGGKAPGTNELRAAGCTWPNVVDTRSTLAFHKFFNDGGPLPEENDYLDVGCGVPANSTTKLPTCEALAAIYAKAVPSERQFVVSVGRIGRQPECRKRFTGDGEFIKDVER